LVLAAELSFYAPHWIAGREPALLEWNRVRPVPSSHWRELDRELNETRRFAVWQWFLFSLTGFTIFEFFLVAALGLKAKGK
jgi:hypothetical protein